MLKKSEKTVVILHNSLKTVPIFRINYIKKLLESSDIIIIAPNDCEKSKVYLEELGVTVLKVPPISGKLSLVEYLVLSNFYVLKLRVMGCYFISHFVTTFIFNFFSLMPFNSRVIIYIEGLGSVFTKSKALKVVLKLLLSMNKGQTLFCNSAEKSQIGGDLDLVTNGIGIDLENFKLKELDFERLQNKKFRLLFVGRLIQDKGVLDAVAVLDGLKLLNVDVSLTLVGDIYPNNPSSITQEAISVLESKYENDIQFLGFSNSVIDWYNYADILLLPSIREGFPVCVMEASSVGIPSFGYDVPGVRDAIKSGVNGYTSQYKDVEGLVNLIYENLSYDKLKCLSKTASQYACTNFDAYDKSDEIIEQLNRL